MAIQPKKKKTIVRLKDSRILEFEGSYPSVSEEGSLLIVKTSRYGRIVEHGFSRDAWLSFSIVEVVP